MITTRERKQIVAEVLKALDARQQQQEQRQYPYTAAQKARQLGISISRLYHIKDTLPYIRQEGRRRIMFS